MRPFSWLAVIATASLLPACFVYDNSLIGGDIPSTGGTGGDVSGTGAAGGETSSGGGETGGTGGTETGGSGGGETGGTGGDTPSIRYTVVDDFEQPGDGYVNPPFFGKRDRYAEPDAVWEADSVADMVEERTDEAGNHSLRVAATVLDEWGVGYFVSLTQTDAAEATDISAYDGLAVSLKTNNSESGLTVAMEDIRSNVDNCSDCLSHAVTPIYMASEWGTRHLSFDSFVRSGDPLDLTQVFSIHFQLKTPSSGESNFEIDDIQFYTCPDPLPEPAPDGCD